MAPFMCRHNEAYNQTFVEIPLDDELFSTLHRRNRRQLQNIRDTSSATLELCRMRKVLQLRGSHEAIESVKKQLQSLNGPRKQVPTAVWAELMRTRTTQLDDGEPVPSPNVSIAGLQLVSGCRVHMERSRCEVRLFGPDDCAARASQLIDAMNDICIEERIVVGNMCVPSDGVLQLLGEEHEAVVVPNDDGLVVLGVRSLVQPLVDRLHRCILNQEQWPVPADVDVEPADLMKLPGERSDSPDMSSRRRNPRDWYDRSMAGGMPYRSFAQPQEGSAPHDCPSTCPTCGVGRFCVECGAPVFNSIGGSWVWVPNDEESSLDMQTARQQPVEQQPQADPSMGSMQSMTYAPPYMYMAYDGAAPKQDMVQMMPMMPVMMQSNSQGAEWPVHPMQGA